MGAALSFLGQKLFASSTLISARCENISCCTSVAAVQPPIVRRTGGFLRKGMTTIYVDSRKRVAGLDSDFEVDLGESERRPACRLQDPPGRQFPLDGPGPLPLLSLFAVVGNAQAVGGLAIGGGGKVGADPGGQPRARVRALGQQRPVQRASTERPGAAPAIP